MGKIPYLFRRNNVFYFRIRVPVEHQKTLNAREIVQSLRTENQLEAIPQALKLAANFKAILNDLKTGKKQTLCRSELIASVSDDQVCESVTTESVPPSPAVIAHTVLHEQPTKTQAPLLSVVVDDFLKRYDQQNKVMLGKLTATLPIFVDLIGDKSINEIFQTDINDFFDEVQKLPVRRDAKIFTGLSIKQIIKTNTGPCIAEKTFISTYRACAGVFLQWSNTNYKDRGFPSLSTSGAVYRGSRADGINKQRAMKPEELQKLFGHPKMKKYAANPETAHYFWLPALGLYTGARINEICQLNPAEDIKQDSATGIYYLSITDEGEAGEGVDKSVKTGSSKRIVPIHGQLIAAGFLTYVERIKREGSKLLFPAWEPRNGKASANAGKWFTRHLESIGLRDETQGARLSGFHSFRHTFITHGMTNKIPGIFAISGHETEVIDGFGKISSVARGYWTRGLTDDIQERKETIEKFDFDLSFYRPMA